MVILQINSIDYGNGVTLRVGRYGPYLERDSDDVRANVPPDVAPDELDEAKIAELFTQAADDGRELGIDPASGHMLIAKNGRFGPYVSEVLPEDADEGDAAKSTRKKKVKPRTASLFKSMDRSHWTDTPWTCPTWSRLWMRARLKQSRGRCAPCWMTSQTVSTPLIRSWSASTR